MKQSRFTEEQIMGVVKEGEAGVPVQEISRKHGICEQTYYRWQAKYGGLEVSEARRWRSKRWTSRRCRRCWEKSSDAHGATGGRGRAAEGRGSE